MTKEKRDIIENVIRTVRRTESLRAKGVIVLDDFIGCKTLEDRKGYINRIFDQFYKGENK